MTTQGFYKRVLDTAKTLKYGDQITIRHIFKNYRNGQGLNLTKFGVLVLNNMGIENETFKLNKEPVFTARMRILLDKYNQYPYYISRRELILYGSEDRMLYKLYGHDLDAWIEHMEGNLER
jgi:hypothetical protein|tara:strand:+ start:2930 stop:3292 length:363 start_codon:yes stop_codon:yes gene_type:complete